MNYYGIATPLVALMLRSISGATGSKSGNQYIGITSDVVLADRSDLKTLQMYQKWINFIGERNNAFEKVLSTELTPDGIERYIMDNYDYPDAWALDGDDEPVEDMEIMYRISDNVNFIYWYYVDQPLEFWGDDDTYYLYEQGGEVFGWLDEQINKSFSPAMQPDATLKHLKGKLAWLRVLNLKAEIKGEGNELYLQITADFPIEKILDGTYTVEDINKAMDWIVNTVGYALYKTKHPNLPRRRPTTDLTMTDYQKKLIMASRRTPDEIRRF